MTYIIHADYQPLNYIISGVDSSQIKEICLKDIKEEFYKLKYCSTVVYMVPRA